MRKLLHPRMRFASKLIEVDYVSPTVRQFYFSVPEEFKFTSGQYITLHVTIGGKREARSYSISSNRLDKGLELCIKLVNDGRVSPFLFDLQVGSTVKIVGPFGQFVVLPELYDSDICFIATGAGIAPFKGIIDDLLAEEDFKGKIYLFFGARYEVELLYKEKWIGIKNTYKDRFHYYRCVTRKIENAPRIVKAKKSGYLLQKSNVYNGRVHLLLKSQLNNLLECSFFICGLSNMIDTVNNLLLAYGVPEEKIHYEKYD